MKKIFSLLLLIFGAFYSMDAFADATVSNDTINLVAKNAFAYDIKLDQTESRSALITYRLNGISYKVMVQAWDATGTTLLKEVPGTLYPNGNRILFNFDGVDIGTEVLFKVKVYSKRVAQPTLIVDEFTDNGAWSFFGPYGVSANNYPFSDTFGRLAVTESYGGTVTVSSTDYQVSNGISYRDVNYGGIGMGLYSFDPRMQPILNKENKYGFTGGQYLDGTTGFDFKRVKYTEDGRLFVSRQTTERASIWEYDPNDLDAYPTDIFGRGFLNTGDGMVYSQCIENYYGDEKDYYYEYMSGPGAGFDVIGMGENLKLVVGSFKYYTEVKYDVSDGLDNYICTYAEPMIKRAYTDEGKLWYTRIDVYELGKQGMMFNGRQQWPTTKDLGKVSSPNMQLGVGAHFNDQRSFNVTFGADGNSIMASHHCANPLPDYGVGQTSYIRIDIDDEAGISGTRKTYTEINPEGAAIAWNKTRTLVAKTLGDGKIGVFPAEYQDSYDTIDAKWVFNPGVGTSINAMAFDYGHNLYFVSHTGEKFLSWALPRESAEFTNLDVETEADTIITPTKWKYTLLAENVTNVKAQGVITVAEPDIWSSVVTWDAPATGLVDYYEVFYQRSYVDANGVKHSSDWTYLQMVGDSDFTPEEHVLSVTHDGLYSEKDDNGIPYRTIYTYKVVPHFTTGILIDKDNESNDIVIYEQSVPVNIVAKQQQDDAGRYSFNLELNVTPKSHLFDMSTFNDVNAIDLIKTYTIVVSEEVALLLNEATSIDNGVEFVKGNVTVAEGAEIMDLTDVWYMQVEAPTLSSAATKVEDKKMPTVVFHNIDPTKNYGFKIYLTSGLADGMALDGWPFFDFMVAESEPLSMIIPGTSYKFNMMDVVRLEDANPVETTSVDMPIGSHRRVGVLDEPTNPVTYDYANYVKTKDAAFDKLNVTNEVVANWTIDYAVDLSVGSNAYATLSVKSINDKATEGLIGYVFADLSYLPVSYTTFIGADGRTYKNSEMTTYSSVVKVNYKLNDVVAVSTESQSTSVDFDLKDYTLGLSEVTDARGVLLTINPEKSSHYDEKTENYWSNFYDGAVMVKRSDTDLDNLYNLVGFHAYVEDLECYGHYENGSSVWVRYHPAYVLTDENLEKYGILNNGKVDFYQIGYNGTNNWSSLAEEGNLLQLYVHYVYATNDVIGADVANVMVDMTADYPILVKSVPDITFVNTVSTLSNTSDDMSMDVFVVPAETITISLSESNRIETGIEKTTMNNADIKLYPNPVDNQLTIIASHQLGYVEILSADGKIVKSINVDDTSVSLNVSELNKGIYIVRTMGKTTIMLKK